MLRKTLQLSLVVLLAGTHLLLADGEDTEDIAKRCYDVECNEGCPECIVLGTGTIRIVKPGCADVTEVPCPNESGSYTDHAPDAWVVDGSNSFGFTDGEAYFDDVTDHADLTIYDTSAEYTDYNAWLAGAGLN